MLELQVSWTRKKGLSKECTRKKCWECGELGHAQRDCLKRRGVVQAVSSSMMIQGEVAGRLTRMLIDTGSGVTLIREDVWRDVLKGGGYGYHLKDLNHPVLTANGQQLNLLGQVELPLHMGQKKYLSSCLILLLSLLFCISRRW